MPSPSANRFVVCEPNWCSLREILAAWLWGKKRPVAVVIFEGRPSVKLWWGDMVGFSEVKDGG